LLPVGQQMLYSPCGNGKFTTLDQYNCLYGLIILDSNHEYEKKSLIHNMHAWKILWRLVQMKIKNKQTCSPIKAENVLSNLPPSLRDCDLWRWI
jgi:hypothetical protein